MNAPLLTVVTVCRNALALLRPTVESVCAQGHAELEYWIIDGDSSDGTQAYLKELARGGIRVLSEPDRGIADAMNKGIARATGRFVAHLHAGDTYLPGTLEAVSARITEDPAAEVICGSMLKREEQGEALYRCDPALLPWDMTVNHPASFVRRDVLVRLGGFDEAFPNAMDYELFLRLHQAGCRFSVLDRPLALMAGGGQSERSLWATLGETHAVRRHLLRSGIQRSYTYLVYVYARARVRRLLQRAGLGAWVDWFRRRFVLMRKG